MNNVLVVVAHPDDEILGCGGTIQKMRAGGGTVKVLCMTSRGLGHETDEARVKAFHRALDMIGIEGECLALSNMELEGTPISILDSEFIRPIVNSFYPDIIITHDKESPNQHHARVAQAVEIAGRGVETFMTFMLAENIERSNGWKPNCYVDLDFKYLENKVKAFSKYDQDKGAEHIRSEQGILIDAAYNGRIIGRAFAETFKIQRYII